MSWCLQMYWAGLNFDSVSTSHRTISTESSTLNSFSAKSGKFKSTVRLLSLKGLELNEIFLTAWFEYWLDRSEGALFWFIKQSDIASHVCIIACVRVCVCLRVCLGYGWPQTCIHHAKDWIVHYCMYLILRFAKDWIVHYCMYVILCFAKDWIVHYCLYVTLRFAKDWIVDCCCW